jgi:hypothetical protein
VHVLRLGEEEFIILVRVESGQVDVVVQISAVQHLQGQELGIPISAGNRAIHEQTECLHLGGSPVVAVMRRTVR